MVEYESLFDERVEVQPPLSAEELTAVPANRGVALLVDADERPIQLLPGADMRGRLRTRLAEASSPQRRTADLREVTASVLWRRTFSAFETDWRYLELAASLWPRSYSRLLPRREAWMLAVDPDGSAPVFAVARGEREAGTLFGPFPDRRSAESYAELLTDAFDLCRCPGVLRQAPHGSACVYKQMGRCTAPCDGTGDMASYRDRVRAAITFACGDHGPYRTELEARMREAAGKKAYEQAAAIKTRLDRLEGFESDKFALVRTIEAPRILAALPGADRDSVAHFFYARGRILDGGEHALPLTVDAAAEALDVCDAPVESESDDRLARHRLALMTTYLFQQGAGAAVVSFREDVTPQGLADRVNDAAESWWRRRGSGAAEQTDPLHQDTAAQGEESSHAEPDN